MLKPFVKWAGGKNQIINVLNKNYPEQLGKRINKYAEPFVGGGAVLFDVLNNYELEAIYVSDINRPLINTYNSIKSNINGLISELKYIDLEYKKLDLSHREEYYYHIRNKYNELILDDVVDNNIQVATLFIFLNKTCFNGLYRENSKGMFNVPAGRYKNPLILDEENLLKISNKIKNVEIFNAHYSNSFDFIDENTFVYLDPPYRPISETSNFTSYSKYNFRDQEQLELAEFVSSLNDKKAYIMLSNSDPKNNDINDNFFDNLYKDFNIRRIEAKRMINSNASNRGSISELLIKNY